jgi:hypothetical protein
MRDISAMSAKPDFEEVWKRVVSRAGEPFFTKTGLRFTYIVEKDRVVVSRVRHPIGRADLARAYALVPVEGPSGLPPGVRGPSYVWAILHDARVSLKQW